MKKDRVFKCVICGMSYKNEKIAKKCEMWCKKHKSCNLDIIKNAVG